MGANKNTYTTPSVRTNQKRFLITGMLLAALFSVFVIIFNALPTSATAGINERFTYQARLLNSLGATVPDGTYNMEFKIYQDGSGCVSGGSPPCSGTLKWTETRTTTNRVTVTNGYFSVELGSVTAFGSSVDWNQDTLWLSINIGGTSGSPTWDGEMTPFRRLGATPYALNSKQLGGLDWSKFVQVAPSAAQIDSSTLSTIFLNKTGASGNILQLQKNGSDVAVIDNSGNVALGLAAPTADLHIDSGTATASALKFTAGTTTGTTAADGFDLGITTSGDAAINQRENLAINFNTNNTFRMTIDNSGRLGLGIASPTSDFHIDRGNATASTQKFTAGTTTGTTSTDGLDIGILSNGEALINQRENLAMGFSTNNTLAMTIKADGSVGIGTNAPANKLHLENGTAGVGLQLTAGATSGLTSNDGLQLVMDSANTGYLNNKENAPVHLATNNLIRLSVLGDGTVGINTTTTTNTLDVNGTVRVRTFGAATASTVCRSTTGNTGILSTCSSALRYKEDIRGLTYGLDTVENLHPISFKWKDRNERGIGFIAEDMAKSVPEVITRNEKGQIEGIDYHLLTAVLTKAIQEQQVQIDQIKRHTWNGGIVTKDTRFKASTLFSGPVKFVGSSTFEGDVKFKGRVTFNKNTAGTTAIKAGKRSIKVTFSKPHTITPIVNATPQAFIQGSFRVKDTSKRGFTIEVSQPQDNDTGFSWSALTTE